MIDTRVINNTIRIRCSSNQTINTDKLKYLYRTGMRFISQHKNFPIIVDLEKNVSLSNNAKKIVGRIEPKWNNKTIVIIAG